MDKDRRKVRKKLTERMGSGDNQTTSSTGTATDARLVALVEFLARRAAERDYAQLIATSPRGTAPRGDKGNIQ